MVDRLIENRPILEGGVQNNIVSVNRRNTDWLEAYPGVLFIMNDYPENPGVAIGVSASNVIVGRHQTSQCSNPK